MDGPHTLTNNADVPAPLKFETDQEKGSSISTDTNDNEAGITTSYQLVTTAFAKGGGNSAEFVSDGDAPSGDESVELTFTNNTNWFVGSGVLIPVDKVIDDIDFSGMSFHSEGAGNPYIQIMVQLNKDGKWAMINNPMASDSTDTWSELGTASGEWKLQIYTTEGESTYFDTDLTESFIKDKLNSEFPNHEVKGIKVQVWGDGQPTGTFHIDDVNGGTGTTWNLESDNLQTVDVTGTTFTMPPLPGEEFDFQVTNEFEMNLVPSDYTIKSKVVPA